MKRLFLLLFILLSINFVIATDVAYVLKNTGSPDSTLTASLNQINVSYSLIDDSLVASTNFSNYKMILVQDDISSLRPIINNFPNIVISDYYYSNWSASVGSFASSQILRGENVLTSPLNTGIPAIFNLYTSCCAGGVSLPASYLSAKKYGLSSTHQVDDIYDYIVSYQNSPRRVFFGITRTDYWSQDTIKLFKNSVQWIMNGADTDGDGKYDYQDNCPLIANANQTDTDSDGLGDVCDSCALDSQNDIDNDGVCGNVDNCPLNSNPNQANFDNDSWGDVCDSDIDNDGISNVEDQCDYTPPNFVIQANGCGKSIHVNINEVELDNLGADINEFVELYNPGNETITLTGWRIQDSRGRVDIISHGEIQANGYFVFTEAISTLDFLNNDSIRLYDVNGTLLDQTPFLIDNADDDRTWQREPDAGELWRFGLSTEGKNNNADITKPIVNLLLPGNNALINNSELTFNYSASDDKAVTLTCYFYGNFDGNFRKWANETTSNGTINSFFAWDIKDGQYLWNIKCSDGYNEAFSNQNRTLIINKPDAPVFSLIGNKTVSENKTLEFQVTASDADNDSLVYSAENLPFGASFLNRIFSWIPSFSQAGDYILRFIVSDGTLEDKINVSIRVDNVNRQPSLVQNIPNKYFDEDRYVEFDLTDYFADLDLDILTYRLENNTNIQASFSGNTARLNSTRNWNGVEEMVIIANDSGFEISSNLFAVAVLEVNDAPVLSSILDISVNEGQVVTITAIASDVDSERLSYSINDSRFSQQDNVFTWQTSYDDSGEYYFLVNVSDGLLEDSKIARVRVNDINEPPHFNPIDPITIDEDSGFSSYNISAYDNDGNISSYSITYETSNVDCEINNFGTLTINPKKDFYGSSNCTIQAKDNSNSLAYANVSITVNNVNDAPIITSFSPAYNPKIGEDTSQEFKIGVADIDNNSSEITINWYSEGVPVGSGDNYNFTGTGESKTYNITAVASDSEFNVPHEWELIASDKPLTDKYNGSTTNFDTANLSSTNLILEKSGIGKIEFMDSVNLENVVDLDRYSDIQRGVAGIDTNIFSSIKNKRAKITFYNLVYNKTPTIYYKSSYDPTGSSTTLCPSSICSEITNANNQISFLVSSFSTYFVGDTLTCNQKGGRICSSNEKCLGRLIEARDSDACCSSTCTIDFKTIDTCESPSSQIEIEIKDPDDNDEFFAGEMIPVEVRIRNRFNEEKEFEIKAVLYDLTNQDEIESWDDTLSISENDKETVDFEIEIPNDIDDGHDFYLYFISSDWDNAVCNEKSVKLDISRNNHQLVFDDFKIDELTECSRNINIEAKIMNVGKRNENTMLVVEIPELNISQKSPLTEIEKYGKDDIARINMLIELPENASGVYNLKAYADYSGLSILKERNITVECLIKQTLALPMPVETSAPEIVKLTGNVKKSVDWSKIINIVLIIAIIIVIIVILILLIKR